MQETEMEGMELEAGRVCLVSPHTSGDSGRWCRAVQINGRRLVFMLLVKTELLFAWKWNLSGVKVDNYNTLPRNDFQKPKQPGERDVYFILKYTLRLLGYVYTVVFMHECGAHISIATFSATD